jgi:prepilin-type N-terminal cleavage/methylation domain-containing protein
MRTRAAAGFTLVELTVVLALAGLVMALVAPGLQVVAASVERAALRDGLLSDIAALNVRAYSLGQGFTLSSGTAGQILSDGKPMLDLPSGWRLEANPPIQFAFSGWCSGGRVRIVAGDGEAYIVNLRASDCATVPG